MPEFQQFSKAVHMQFSMMSQQELYTVNTGETDIFDVYLNAFPEGTNPIYRERTTHDCSCCKNFVRRIGHTVMIADDGSLVTVWDVMNLPEPYNTVAAEMSRFVKSCKIDGVFRSREHGFGAESTIELIEGNNTKKWHHFHGSVASHHQTQDVEAERGGINSVAGVFLRGLRELKLDALVTVKELIQENALYRGAEHMVTLKMFLDLKKKFNLTSDTRSREIFVWKNIHSPVARFRNTVIGTLVQDLSEGVELERAVKSFESKVAPANYKRPTALITPRMVEDAMKTVKQLNLEPALQRRHARISDVMVNDVLFVDNTVEPHMKGSVTELLMSEARVKNPPIDERNAEEIPIDEFMKHVVPSAKSIDAFVRNSHMGKFVSLTAPVDKISPEPLFKWGNNFAWSYDGNVTDSIKEKVKRAGGNVDAKLRVSLAWFNTDDLDIHVTEPGGNHISYRNKNGKLDVDMNVHGDTREPVENVSWTHQNLKDGEYVVHVHNYKKRESVDVGFTLEIEFNGLVYVFNYDKPLRNGEHVESLIFTVQYGLVVDMKSKLKSGSSSIEKWNVNTEKLVPVDTIMNSPNYWHGGAVGNKHWFFILKGCLNPEPTRGIYNEFLKPELERHRKVFEILGDKTKCEFSDQQLSGLGFSSTLKDTLTVLVKSEKSQGLYKVTF